MRQGAKADVPCSIQGCWKEEAAREGMLCVVLDTYIEIYLVSPRILGALGWALAKAPRGTWIPAEGQYSAGDE